LVAQLAAEFPGSTHVRDVGLAAATIFSAGRTVALEDSKSNGEMMSEQTRVCSDTISPNPQ
jgi:hypothetical protein